MQFYEITFELAWKTLKDYLEYKSVLVKFPRETIKEAFRYELIADGEIWLDMLDKRNLMAYTYNETLAEEAHTLITKHYFNAIQQVYDTLKTELQ